MPYYARCEEQRMRRVSEMKLNHEMKRPVNFTLLALGALDEELKSKLKTGETLAQSGLAAALDWLRLTTRLLQTEDLIAQESYTPYAEMTSLLEDVVWPVKDTFAIVLRAKRLPAERIEIQGLKDLPRLYIDPNHFQQIVFNLLDNAIKYAGGEPSEFRIQIAAQVNEKMKRILLDFRDWGLGIPEGWQRAIFREGIRAPNAVEKNVQGNGFGLSIVDRLVRVNGGRIFVRGLRKPTEIRISLPLGLTKKPAEGMEIADARTDGR
jgi:signal transduction histidine kinase